MNNSWWLQSSQLDQEQKKIVTLPLDGRYLIEGPPGSGKTNLLALRATYLQKAQRPNFVIVTFARGLREFLAHGLSKYGIDNDSVKTSNRWAKSILFAHGITPKSGETFPETRRILESQLSDLISNQTFTPYYDCILLDEAHDYTEKELDIFSAFANNLFLVADLNQRIYSDTLESSSHMNSITTTHATLKYHYRNGLNICRLADEVSNSPIKLVDTSNYNESENPSRIECTKFSSFSSAVDTLVERLQNQLSVYTEEYIGILCPTHSLLEQLKKCLRENDIFPHCSFHDHEDNVHFSDTKRIYCLTLHSAKGLEFRAVHMFGWDTIRNQLNRNMTYTAITRAKTSLSIYYFKKMNNYLQQALDQMNPSESLPQIEDLFPEV